jgi:hypothetical protein
VNEHATPPETALEATPATATVPPKKSPIYNPPLTHQLSHSFVFLSLPFLDQRTLQVRVVAAHATSDPKQDSSIPIASPRQRVYPASPTNQPLLLLVSLQATV